MRHPLRWVALAVGVLVATLGVVLASQVHTSPTFTGGPILGRRAPAFDLPVLGGGARVRLADLAGKSVIVNFWNSWCIPCRQEEPALAEFHARHVNDPSVVLVGVLRDDTESAARAYVEEKGITWTIVTDPGSRAALDFGTTGQPETYAISPEGVVTGKQLSRASVGDLEAMLASTRAG